MSAARLKSVPQYADSVAARENFEREHPDARIWKKGRNWHGSMLLGRNQREVCPCSDLGDLLRLMRRLAAVAAEVAAIEEEFSDWHVWLSNVDRWWAVRRGPDANHTAADLRPMTIDADDAAGLRALIAEHDEAWV